MAALKVVVDDSEGLHRRVDGGWADETEACTLADLPASRAESKRLSAQLRHHLAASTTVSDTPDTLLMSTRVPSGVTATPLVSGGLGTVAATCASLARMTDSWALDAAKSREPSGLMASSVGGVQTGMVATIADAGSDGALGAWPPRVAHPASTTNMTRVRAIATSPRNVEATATV
jgi:hypothetical protein